MIDNTHVVVLRGTGSAMIAVPEMEAFGERFGFRFVAHERGDANRAARVERPFSFIENNFLAGRTFAGWEDLNRQAREWCDKVNSTYKKHLRAVPRELFAIEQVHLKPLPAWIPEVYRLYERTVDVEGYVCPSSTPCALSAANWPLSALFPPRGRKEFHNAVLDEILDESALPAATGAIPEASSGR